MSDNNHTTHKKEQEKPNPVELTKEEELTQQIGELTELLQRTRADFENYQKRMEKQQLDGIKFASESMITKLLPIIDNLDLVVKHQENPKECVAGILMIADQIHQTLSSSGLKIEPLVGKQFDPSLAQAVSTKPGTPDGVVLEELQKCYKLHDKIIRQGRVVVAKEETHGTKKHD